MSTPLAVPAQQPSFADHFEETLPLWSLAFPPAFGIVLRKSPAILAIPYVMHLRQFLSRNAASWTEAEDLFGWSCANCQGDLEWIRRKLEQVGLEWGVDFVQTAWPGEVFPAVSWLKVEPASGTIGFCPEA